MILVVADHDRGVLDPLSLQAVTAARAIDDRVEVLVTGSQGAAVAPELAEHGAAVVHVATADGFADYAPLASARAAAELVARLSPAAVLAPGSPRGNEVMAHLGALLDLPMAADCVSLSPSADGVHEVVRNRWGGNLLETARVHAPVLLATVAPHAVPAEPAPAAGEVQEFAVALSPADTAVRVIDRVGDTGGGIGLADARVVVSGGRGVGADGFGPIDELAELLGGAVGCSRVVTSAGWRPHSEQVGQTGTKVSPDLYLAFGISGATQHIAGCRTAKTIIAINNDKDAPIMGYAHYAVIGDLHQVLPALVAATRAAKG
jgi:electron transfer flavoprotein alpha subunit